MSTYSSSSLDQCCVKIEDEDSSQLQASETKTTESHNTEQGNENNETESKTNNTVDNEKMEIKEERLGESQIDEDGEEVNGDLVLSHQEVMIKIQSTLSDIISSDPLLYDLPPQVTLEEVNNYIALEHGQAMLVNVRRADNETLPVVVNQNATVLDLKQAIRRHVNLRQERASGITHLNWVYIWRRYWLYYNGEKLMDDKKRLKDYDIRNREEVTFIRRLKEKGKRRR